ncbi:MAG TPA: 2-C-methyl-D-erythritol 4-phosphate cytidylyltransferase [Vicinamibacterales bacterium]|jgi:2-C-methyl-D-erythritol 4-phosphate cytidylyltransferase/2-C-methyl-D-erythritol 2,4-cyclodiphosphate synthase
MRVTAIIAAGGSGRRMGSRHPKQLLDLGGRTILSRSVRAFDSHPSVSDLVVVVPSDLEPARAHEHIGPTTRPLTIVPGGPRRQDSVANAFASVDPSAEIVLIHDAARPFVSAEVIDRTIEAAAAHGAAIAAVEASDTVKRVERHPHGALIVETIPRGTIFMAQTPQGFRREVLADAVALGRSGEEATDEASLAERAGHPVHVVAGESGNVKITTEEDLIAARRRAEAVGRVGTGYDLHRLVEGRPLSIAGVALESGRGPVAHSDGDVACHAAIDAMLGAAGLGDIGRHFPDSDPEWKGAPGLDLLNRAAQLIAKEHYEVANLDVTVVLESPKLKDHIEAMRAAMAGALGIDPARISVKAKTNEGIDAIGRGEAIAAHAVALLRFL